MRQDKDNEWDLAESPEDDEPSTYPCPYCRTPVFDDAEQCPKCGNYISSEDVEGSDVRRWWIVLGLIASLVVALMWIFPF